MAGKKNFQESTNKSAKAGKKKEEGFQACPEVNRIIPLSGGEYAYLLDPRDGRTHRLRVGSDAWDRVTQELFLTTYGPRIQAELEKLGWPGSTV